MANQMPEYMELSTDAELTAFLNESQTDSNDIDKMLTDKAEKNQFTKPNVKNLIKNVLMNEDVATMLRQTLSDDGDCLFEPKLTRAKIKEMLKNYPASVHQWSPFQKQSKNECKSLIEKEFPEDSEDEEYRPDEECRHDEDDFDDDDESKCTEINKSYDESEVESNLDTNKNPSIGDVNDKETIGMRTRSKLSLSDTPLEIIEQAFIPPDITEDMYDWVCDNDEWNEFLSDFKKPLESVQNDDPEDDPEYNILGDDDLADVDQEEFRIDRSVKISRKECDDLMKELNDYTDMYLEFNGPESQELEIKSVTENDNNKNLVTDKYPNDSVPVYNANCSSWEKNSIVQTTNYTMPTKIVTESIYEQIENKKKILSLALKYVQSNNDPRMAFDKIVDTTSQDSQSQNVIKKNPIKKISTITKKQLILLKDQLTKHVQLTTQNYLLCTMVKQLNVEARKSKKMLEDIKDVCQNKVFAPINIDASLKFVQDWNEFQLIIEDTNKNIGLLSSDVQKFMLFYDPPLFIYPNLLPTRTIHLNPPNFPIGRSEEMFLVLKIEQVYNNLKEGHSTRAKYRTKSLSDSMPDIVKTVHRRWFSHRPITSFKQHISKRRNSFQPSILRNYLVHGVLEDVVHMVDMESVFHPTCLDKCNIQTFPTSWKSLVRQLSHKTC